MRPGVHLTGDEADGGVVDVEIAVVEGEFMGFGVVGGGRGGLGEEGMG